MVFKDCCLQYVSDRHVYWDTVSSDKVAEFLAVFCIAAALVRFFLSFSIGQTAAP